MPSESALTEYSTPPEKPMVDKAKDAVFMPAVWVADKANLDISDTKVKYGLTALIYGIPAYFFLRGR